MKSSQPVPATCFCSRCGECCRWLPFAIVRQCKPHQLHYLRERGLEETDGYFLIDAPCRHLKQEAPDGNGSMKWACAIYDTRPATCRDFCGKALSGGKRYYVPQGCTMAGGREKKQQTGRQAAISPNFKKGPDSGGNPANPVSFL
jgi:hypothetical protein